jgi:hypothetical protein
LLFGQYKILNTILLRYGNGAFYLSKTYVLANQYVVARAQVEKYLPSLLAVVPSVVPFTGCCEDLSLSFHVAKCRYASVDGFKKCQKKVN